MQTDGVQGGAWRGQEGRRKRPTPGREKELGLLCQQLKVNCLPWGNTPMAERNLRGACVGKSCRGGALARYSGTTRSSPMRGIGYKTKTQRFLYGKLPN
eukprot:110578-Rhodomonas_salina.3